MLVTSWTDIIMSQILLGNTFILRRPRVVNFADIIKIATTFIKVTRKDLQSISVFLGITKIADFR